MIKKEEMEVEIPEVDGSIPVIVRMCTIHGLISDISILSSLRLLCQTVTEEKKEEGVVKDEVVVERKEIKAEENKETEGSNCILVNMLR